MEKSPNNTPVEAQHMTDEQQAAAWLNLAGVKDKDAEELADASAENQTANQVENSAEMDTGQKNKSSWDTLGDDVPFGKEKRSKRTMVEIEQDKANLDYGADLDVEKYDRLEVERRQVEQQTEDAAVLLSFCDINQVQEILSSDNYGVLLENDVSLEGLFGADVLFREQYDINGYTMDRKWRRGGEGQPNFKLKNLNKRYLESADALRADEARQAIDIVATTYFGEDSTPEDKREFKNILQEVIWHGREKLTEGQKAFLRKDFNTVSDRLLHGSKTVDAERAEDIATSIDGIEAFFERRSEYSEETVQVTIPRLTENLCHAAASIEDYNEYNKDNLVFDARWKLAKVSDEHAEEILAALATSKTFPLNYDDMGDAEELVLNYIHPETLIKILRENDGLMESLADRGIVVDGDYIAAAIKDNIWTPSRSGNLANNMSYLASDLILLAASDEEILHQLKYDMNAGNLHAGEFMSADKGFEGIGTRFLEAGVNREMVLARIYNSDNSYPQNRDAFRPQTAPWYEDKSWFDIMSERGFSATEIAETFAPDDIARRLPEFLEHGADAKELTKYMLSYRERFESGYKTNKDGTREYASANLSGEQAIRVYDENHPEGRVISKEMMFGEDGVEYVMLNLDTLADNGVTEEDIVNNAPKTKLSPGCDFLETMLECKKFDPAKVLELSFQRYLELLKESQESGIYSKDDVEYWSDKGRYYVNAMNALDGFQKEQRNKRRELVREHLEQVEEAERKGIEG